MAEKSVEEIMARAMAENAGFRWEACAQNQWVSDARAGLVAAKAHGYEITRKDDGMVRIKEVNARGPVSPGKP